MKKILSFLLAVVIFLLSMSMAVSAANNRDGMNALIKEFHEGDYIYDYYFYSPVKSASDKTKYPVILWLHGQLSGDYKGDQVRQSDIVYLASEENQAKIKATKGAYILVPRYPTLNVNLAWQGENANIKKFLDKFIADRKDTIDTNRIYVGGYSMGGKAAISFTASYPGYVAAIFPASSIYPLLSSPRSDLAALADTPAWFFTSKDDDFWGKPVPQQSDWETFRRASNVKNAIRWTQFDMPLYNYDGSVILTIGYNEHNAWDPMLHDLIMQSGSMYPNMTTVNGLGGKVILKEDNSFISWLSSQSLNGVVGEEGDDSEDDDQGGSDSGNQGSSGLIFKHVREILEYVVNIFDRVFKRLFGYNF